jgi:hypothetical protein
MRGKGNENIINSTNMRKNNSKIDWIKCQQKKSTTNIINVSS